MKILSILLALVFTLTSCAQEVPFTQELKPETFILQSEPFAEVLELTGTLEANRETPVAAKTSGRIAQINVEEGDFVIEGNLLAALAGDESSVGVQTATTNEQNIQNAYNSQKLFLDQQIQSAEQSLSLAEANLRISQTSSSDTQVTSVEQKELAQAAVNQAEVNLENTKNIAAQRITSLYKNASSTIRSAFIAATNANDFADKVLGVSSAKEYINDYYEDNLGALNSSAKADAESSLRVSLNLKDNFKILFDEKIDGKTPSNTEFDAYLEQALILLEATQTSLKNTYATLDNSSTGSNFTEANLSQLKQEAANLGSNVEASILSVSSGTKMGIKGILLTRDEIQIQNTSEIASAESALLQAKQAFNQAKAVTTQNVSGTAGQEEIAAKQIEQAKSALASAKAQKESSLKNLQTQIDLVKGNKQLSQVAFLNTHIAAPFTGIVTEKFAEIGQVVAAGQPVFSVADTSLFKIKTEVADTQIKFLHLGLEAEIVIDGLPGKFTADLTKIAPKVDAQTRKLTIELTLNETPDQARIGMFARISLKASEQNMYFVPYSFIHASPEGPFIFLESGEKQFVSLGRERGNEIKIWFEGEMEGLQIVKK